MSTSSVLTQITGSDSRDMVEDVINPGRTIDIYKAIEAANRNPIQSSDELLDEFSQLKSFSTIPIFDYEIISNTIEGDDYLTGRRDQI